MDGQRDGSPHQKLDRHVKTCEGVGGRPQLAVTGQPPPDLCLDGGPGGHGLRGVVTEEQSQAEGQALQRVVLRHLPEDCFKQRRSLPKVLHHLIRQWILCGSRAAKKCQQNDCTRSCKSRPPESRTRTRLKSRHAYWELVRLIP